MPIPFIVGSLFMKLRARGLSSDHQQLVNSDSAYSMASKGPGSGKTDYENLDKQKGYYVCKVTVVILLLTFHDKFPFDILFPSAHNAYCP